MSEKIKITPDMTIEKALATHPRAREVFAGYHLGGCAHCSINEFETIEQVCGGYGVPVEAIISALEGLQEDQ